MKPNDDARLLGYVEAAVAGDAPALETLLAALKDPLFRLALRTLGNFADAEDATQEILVKIMTGLAAFERRSSLRTWAYRIAVNHLHDAATRRRAKTAESFDAVAAQLEHGFALTADAAVDVSRDPALLLEAREVGLHCTQAILMCLDVGERLAYVLSEIFDFDARTGARIVGVGESAYRQRLSRGRRRLAAFMNRHCGLVSPEARCRCERQALALRRVRKGNPVRIEFARGEAGVVRERVEQARAELSRLQRIAVVFRDHPQWSAPDTLLDNVRRVLNASTLLKPSTPARLGS